MLVLLIILFFLGAVFGSFGGVVVERGEEGFSWGDRKNVFGGRSFCPGCNGKQLVRRQLIPLIGRLIQKGKCFRCHKPIPGRYCIIELIMGAVFVATGWLYLGDMGLAQLVSLPWIGRVSLGFWLLLNRTLVCLIIADIQYYVLNVYIWIILLVLTILYYALLGVAGGSEYVLTTWLVPGVGGALILSGLFAFLYWAAKVYASKKMGEPTEGMGEGDVLMAITLGLLSPFVLNILPDYDRIVIVQLAFVYLIISSSLGILYRIIRRGIAGEDNPHLPFLPAMIIAFWILLGFGEKIIGLLG